ncbi:MAG: exodeoxyribonuclease III [Chitinophagaceae bacterium]|nr:exodeoxyribonuclease III [Chitinophagaceae bacterium]
MRIITYNVNGIRAAIRKGFIDWLKTDPADIICVQEIKAQESDIDRSLFEAAGYQPYFYSAEKKGYSGVGILTKLTPDRIKMGNGNEQSDNEGRILQADFGDLTVISAYFPSGTSGDERQTYKYQWLDEFFDYLKKLRKKRKQLVICGDYNIAHKEIDIHNPKSNKNSSGFLPEERAWMDKLFANGFIDTFRKVNQQPHQYTWWHQLRKSTRLENKGWRIDYISVTDNLESHIHDAEIYPMVQHSDHCPMAVTLRF